MPMPVRTFTIVAEKMSHSVANGEFQFRFNHRFNMKTIRKRSAKHVS
jgi:hypothetical protein